MFTFSKIKYTIWYKRGNVQIIVTFRRFWMFASWIVFGWSCLLTFLRLTLSVLYKDSVRTAQ